MDTPLDDQTTRQAGAALLEAALVREGFAVDRPARDRRVDLVVRDGTAAGPGRAIPIQVHTSPRHEFDLDGEIRGHDELVLAYVWQLADRPRFFLLSTREALELADHSVFFREFGHFAHHDPGGHLLRKIEECEDRWEWLRRRLRESREQR